jgi:hypothetical protein
MLVSDMVNIHCLSFLPSSLPFLPSRASLFMKEGHLGEQHGQHFELCTATGVIVAVLVKTLISNFSLTYMAVR